MFARPLIPFVAGLYTGLCLALVTDHGAALWTALTLGLLVGAAARNVLDMQRQRDEASIYRLEQHGTQLPITTAAPPEALFIGPLLPTSCCGDSDRGSIVQGVSSQAGK